MAWYLHAVCILAIIAAALDLIYIFIALIKEIRKGCKSKTELVNTTIPQEVDDNGNRQDEK